MEEIDGFDPVLPVMMAPRYKGRKHRWIVLYETKDYVIAKCELCLQDAVIYYDMEHVAEKLFGYKYGKDYKEEDDRQG